MSHNNNCVDYLPQSLKDISEKIGIDETLKLIKIAGGQRLYIPQSISSNHKLAELNAATIAYLSENYSGGFLQIPRATSYQNCLRNHEITEAKGKSTAKIAISFGLTERHIYHIRKQTMTEQNS